MDLTAEFAENAEEKEKSSPRLKLSVLGVLKRSGRLIKAYERPVDGDFGAAGVFWAFGFRSRRNDQPMLAARPNHHSTFNVRRSTFDVQRSTFNVLSPLMHRASFPSQSPLHYASLRNELRTGDLLLCSGTGWFSQMIQAATGSVWSHVACIVRLELIDRVMVLESLEPVGVRSVPLSKYLRDYDSRGKPYPGQMCIARHKDFEAHASPADLARFGHFAVDQLGYPYDNQMIAKIAARITLTQWLDKPARDEALDEWADAGLERDSAYICSEYVWECYQSLGLDIAHDPMGFVSPADIASDPAVELIGVLRSEGG